MADQWADAQPLDNFLWATDTEGHFENPYGEQSFSDDPVSDPPPDMTGYGQVWRTVTPTQDIQLTLRAQTFQETDSAITAIWSRVGSTWATVVAPTAPVNDVTIHADLLTTGTVYYVMFASGDAANPAPGIKWAADELSASQQIDEAPPIAITVTVAEDPSAPSSNAPPIAITLGLAGTPSLPTPFPGSIELTAPDNAAELPTSTPQFIVAVTSDNLTDLYTVAVQYADNSDFNNPTELTGTTDAATGGVTLTPASPVPDTTYWRAQLRKGTGVLIDWTDWNFFTVSTHVDSTALPVVWSVNASAARPIHVWHLDPPGPLDGDTVTIYGQGFPASGTLTFGDTVLPTTSWQLVAATTANADDTTRVIEGSSVTPEHYEVQFVAPVDDGPGAALVLEA